MSGAYLVKFLGECMNIPPEQAQKIVEILTRAEVIQPDHLNRWERTASIYHLRGNECGNAVDGVSLSKRFGLARSKVFKAIRDHARRRREALKATS
jgi:hypothetical protein